MVSRLRPVQDSCQRPASSSSRSSASTTSCSGPRGPKQLAALSQSPTVASEVNAPDEAGVFSSTSVGAKALDTDEPPPLRKHSDLWFDDGSVICRAEDTLFKVHMSQLARHSLFFRDMFSLPQPELRSAEAESNLTLPLEDKIPLIVLHDTAEDVGNLFTALYDGPNFGNNDQDDFRMASGILRLSTKYIVDSLRAKAIAHLNMAWPSTLKAWDTREDFARTYEADPASTGGHLYPHPIAVINLAREVNAPSLLPAAFYDLSRYSFAHIFEPAEDDPADHPLSPPPSHLSIADMQRLCLGKEASQHAITSLIAAMGSSQYVRHAQLSHHSHSRKISSSGICVSAAACRKDFSELVDLATQHYLFDRERGCYDPLYVAEELGQLKSAEFSECKACAKSLEAWAAREREKMWKSIPLWFRLEYSADSSPRLC